MHGFQIWVNLPKRDKLMAPRYQEVPSAQVPKATSPDGRADVAVIAGEALGVGAVIDTRTPILYHDWTLRPGAAVDVPVPPGFRVMAYVFGGSITTGPDERPVRDGQLAVFGAGDAVRLWSGDGARVLLLGGEPLREPVARYGPFVMNTPAEIREAILDFQNGRLGQIDR
jgi:redox-sensitive bicupin YhaK (pirin superfamily)